MKQVVFEEERMSADAAAIELSLLQSFNCRRVYLPYRNKRTIHRAVINLRKVRGIKFLPCKIIRIDL